MKTLHLKAIPFLMVLSLLVSFSVTHAQGWYNTDWQYRKEITIDNTKVFAPTPSTELANFPVLVNVTVSAAQSEGEDILFTDYTGTKLAHEIESYDNGSGALVAWVKIPNLSSISDTVIYVYYDNLNAGNQQTPTAVWDTNYVMVQHLEETSGNHINSTSSTGTNDGTPSGGVTQDATGQINGADGFDGAVDTLVNCGNDSTLDITGSLTVEAWAYSNISSPSQKRIVSKDRTGIPGKFMLWETGSAGNLTFQVYSGSAWAYAVGDPIDDEVWMHVVGVYDTINQEVSLYVDGILVTDPPVAAGFASLASNPSENLTIGSADEQWEDPPSPTDEYKHNWDGIIDEVRISKTARSAEWIETSYNNQNQDPLIPFYTVENEETVCLLDTECSFCEKCEAGICVLQVNEDLKDDCALCEKCDAGSCTDQADTEDVKDECPDGDCVTGFCDGLGACGVETSGIACGDTADTDCTAPDTCDDAGVCNDNHAPETTPCEDEEFCTDGDTCDGDGNCQPGVEDPCAVGEVCNETTNSCDLAEVCGNGSIEGTEECDDGNTDDGDCCSSTCTFEANGSTCDDGAYCTDGDSCDGEGNCQPGDGDPCQAGEVCNESTNSCDSVPVCGNGTLEGTEECDDGNTDDGDCCSSTCTFEANGSTCDDGAYCTVGDACDGDGNCQPGAGDPCTPLEEVCDEGSDQCIAAAPGIWWNCAWPYRKELTIDHTKVDEDLTNFPVLVDVTVSAAQTEGEDIVFTDINGTQLSHEIELYDDGTGQLIAWVNVPSVSSSVDTTLYMYFGNDVITSSQEDVEGTWDTNYVMVQHLNETSPDIHNDSTSKNNDGVPSVTTQGIASGQIDGADAFDGVDDNVNCGNDTSLDIIGSMTVEAWALSTGGTGSNRILAKDPVGTPGKFILWRNPQEELAFIVADTSGVTDPWHRAKGFSITDGLWFQVVGVFDADSQQVRLYKDGDLVTGVDGPASIQSNTETVTIGSSDDNDHNWVGTIDEVRISKVARSGGWIKTSHNNQDDPASFASMGDLEDQCEGNFDCDLDVDGSDAQLFKLDFGRPFGVPPRPCTNEDPCNGDFDCDGNVDGGDAIVFKHDFGRSEYLNPCPPCVEGECCSY